MKNCELCRNPARTYCESDLASLCWDCDAKVHGANFLVARHSRTLLCHACQSPTPWQASGAVLGNTVSVCPNCDGGMNLSGDDGEESEAGNDTEINSDDDDDDADGDEVDDDVEEDHQIVPWSSTTPPPPASSSSSDESNNGDRNVSESGTTVSLKRRRENASNHHFQMAGETTELTKLERWWMVTALDAAVQHEKSAGVAFGVSVQIAAVMNRPNSFPVDIRTWKVIVLETRAKWNSYY